MKLSDAELTFNIVKFGFSGASPPQPKNNYEHKETLHIKT